MSEHDDTQYDDGIDDGNAQHDAPRENGEEPGWRKRLTSDRDKAKAERDALKRENAFLKAGINPDDVKAKWLVKGYDGELTPEAIKQAATEAGILQAADDEAESTPADEVAAHKRQAAISTGGVSTDAHNFDARIAEARAAGQHQRVIELKQAQSAEARNTR